MFFETIEAEMLDDCCDILADYRGTGQGNFSCMTALKDDYGLNENDAIAVITRVYTGLLNAVEPTTDC